ncbi:alpha-2B adrenergic receptor-like [Hetaerina americana]|uniref:alpha-2B adrenergic receptor-like n=1 Tax=Hetaerina americana TaxID=62018 RepID=UPI003A7F5356
MDPHGKIVETSVLVVCDIVLVIVFLLGTASNFIVLLVFYRRPGLRTLSNRFVINLLATNLLACCVLLPLVFADNVRGHGDASPALCAVSEGVAAAICAASVLAVLLVAVDQFLAVVDPLHYHMRINAPRSAAMIATAWISAAFLGLLGAGTPLLIVGADPGGSLWHSCGAGAVDSPPASVEQVFGETVANGEALKSPAAISTYRAAFSGVYAILVFAIPVVALCCIYLRIYAAAHRNSQRTRRTGSGPLCPIPQSHFEAESSAPSAPAVAQPLLPPHPTTTISITPPTPTGAATTPPTLSPSPCSPPSTPPSIPSTPQSESVKVTPPTPPHTSRAPSRTPSRAASVRSTSSQFVNSLKYRISNASLFRYREEARAARVSALVVVMALVCWFPYTAALVLHSGIFTAGRSIDVTADSSSPHYMDAVSLTLLSAGSLVSPCLFAYRNRRLQREVRKLLGLRRGFKQRGTMRQSNTTHHNGTFLNGGGSVHNPNRLPANYSNTALELFSSLTESKAVPVTAAESHIGVDIPESKKRKDGCLPLPTIPPPSGGHCTGKKFLVTVYGRSRWSRNSSEKATCEFVPESALNVDTCRSSFSSGTTQGTSSTDNVEE